jgi:gas vesicle protein
MARRGGGLEFLSGLFIGGMLGAVIGLLLAPQSGQETRAQLREPGIELKDELQERAAELQEKVPTIVEEQRARIQEAYEKGKAAAAKRRQEILGALEAESTPGEPS